MKTIIFFREGLSGHYLKALIDNSKVQASFRMDPWYPGIYNTPKPIKLENCVCVHKHLVDYLQLEKQYELSLTIQVRKKIYQAIYNNFYKKLLVENSSQRENFKTWTTNLSTWYDQTFYNIKEYYQIYQQDLVENTFPNVIEFDNLLDLDYIQHLLMHYYNRPLTKNIKRIVKDYSQLQVQYDLCTNGNDMKDIVSVLPDQVFRESPWFASYCIFKYETNNNLQENQRQWSIDSVTEYIDKSFLLSIASQYQV